MGLFLASAQAPATASFTVPLTTPATVTQLHGYWQTTPGVTELAPNDAIIARVGFTTNFTVTGLVSGQTYYFAAAAIDGSGEGPLGSEQVRVAA